MGIRDVEEGGYGSREDADGSANIEEEARPLRSASIELHTLSSHDSDHDSVSSRYTPQPLGSSSSGRWRVWNRIRNACDRLGAVVGGRHTPRIQKISPWWPAIDGVPAEWLAKTFSHRYQQGALLILFCISWIVVVATTLSLSNTSGGGQLSRDPVQHIDCTTTLWRKDNGCGLDGSDCRPFNGTSFAFRCTAYCAQVSVWNPHAVGTQDIVYRPLVVGGPIYRGDSFICGSAIHAGVISDAYGGCGIVSRIGQHDDFPASSKNGVESIGFDSHFPLAFEFKADSSGICDVTDQRWLLLAISMIFTTLISIFITSAPLHFFLTFTCIFAHTSLISDPSGVSDYSVTVLPELFSNFIGRFLPAAFCAIVLYRTCIKYSLDTLEAQLEKTILWVGGCWFGALSNYTFDWIPLQRLTAHDLEHQPGAKLSLAILVSIIVLVLSQQVYYFRLERRLLSYLGLYAMFVSTIIFCLLIPGLNLRLHHYILAMLLLPGTKLQTRPSLLYQGLLIGLFINGIARWGFDPVLQTSRALQAEGDFGSILPSVLEPVISLGAAASNISFTWSDPPPFHGYDGMSVLVNDVERYRKYFSESSSTGEQFTWERTSSALPEYFRFGFLNINHALDYTRAGIWHANGSWSAGPHE